MQVAFFMGAIHAETSKPAATDQQPRTLTMSYSLIRVSMRPSCCLNLDLGVSTSIVDWLLLCADIALMHFFGALDDSSTLPNRASLKPRTDDRNLRVCRTIGAFAVYMHDFGLDKFDSRFRDDVQCWNATGFGTGDNLTSGCSSVIDRHYTWWCNKRPNNPCVFNCPNQVRSILSTVCCYNMYAIDTVLGCTNNRTQ